MRANASVRDKVAGEREGEGGGKDACAVAKAVLDPRPEGGVTRDDLGNAPSG